MVWLYIFIYGCRVISPCILYHKTNTPSKSEHLSIVKIMITWCSSMEFLSIMTPHISHFLKFLAQYASCIYMLFTGNLRLQFGQGTKSYWLLYIRLSCPPISIVIFLLFPDLGEHIKHPISKWYMIHKKK